MNRDNLLGIVFLGLAAALLLAPITGEADTIGTGTNPCGNNSCDGATYTLTYSGSPLPDADPAHETFRITLHIDTTGYTGGGSFLDNVGVKVSAPPNLFDASLFAAPGGTGNWSDPGPPNLNSTVNSSGCSSTGGGGWVCIDGLANVGKGVALPGPFDFTFDITVDNGGLFTGANQASIKARYVDASGNKIGSLLSENITLQDPPNVPEPSTLLLVGCGLVGLVIVRRRGAQRQS